MTRNTRVTGYIPEKITAVCRPPVQVEGYDGSFMKVRPAFMVDSANERTLSSALAWAGGRRLDAKHTSISSHSHTPQLPDDIAPRKSRNMSYLAFEQTVAGSMIYAVIAAGRVARS